jgi:RING finger protein 170
MGFPEGYDSSHEYRRTDTTIQGVGDDVIMTISALFALLVAVLALVAFLSRRPTRGQVHPLAQEEVQRVRETYIPARGLRNGPLGGNGANDIPHGNNEPAGPREDRRRDGEGQACPICLVDMVEPVETNCGHMFCAGCFAELWRRSTSWPAAVQCPICRQLVTLLLPSHRLNPDAEESESSGVLFVLMTRSFLPHVVHGLRPRHANTGKTFVPGFVHR